MKTDNKNVVVIFAKKPELGKTKSRITVDTSPEFALDILIHVSRILLTQFEIRTTTTYSLPLILEMSYRGLKKILNFMEY